ncbi:MAG: hypothetical protein PVI23_11340 [Maricaulaceae bacterium]|jgi:hypothetical protein
MPRGDWLRILAVAGLILLAPSGQAQEQTDEPDRPADEQQEGARPFAIPVEIIEEPEAAETRERREQEAADREQADLLAQQGMDAATKRMAKYAFWQTMLIGIGTAALLYTLFLTRQANRAAWDAVRVAEEVGKRQTRAYVGGHSAALESAPGGGLYCHFDICNFGQSPAEAVEVKVQLRYTITAKGQEWPTSKEAFDEMCRHPRSIAPHGKGRCTVHIPPDTIAKVEAESPEQIRFYCIADVWWFDVFDEGCRPENELHTRIMLSQPVGSWSGKHWTGDLEVSGSDQEERPETRHP